ncbi:hypothetical protein CsatB_028879 [Cannabis sativa]
MDDRGKEKMVVIYPEDFQTFDFLVQLYGDRDKFSTSTNNSQINSTFQPSSSLLETKYTRDTNEGDIVSPSTHINKRHKSKSDGEITSCKNCNCKKNGCLKLTCKCVASSIFCSGSCHCRNCSNTISNESNVLLKQKEYLSRDPYTFTSKIVVNATTNLATHIKGCNCQKGCSTKYCKCFNGQAGCSRKCKCIGCENNFNQKNGIEEREVLSMDSSKVIIPFGDHQQSTNYVGSSISHHQMITRDETSFTLQHHINDDPQISNNAIINLSSFQSQNFNFTTSIIPCDHQNSSPPAPTPNL